MHVTLSGHALQFTLESAYFLTFSKGLKEYIYQDFLPLNLFDIYS